MSGRILHQQHTTRPKGSKQGGESTNQALVALAAQQTFAGPIPHPDILKGYEEISQGFADRVITMAERQQEHRMQLEKEIIRSESRDSFLGVLFAFVLGIGSLTSAVVIAFLGNSAANAIGGSLLGITGIGAIAISFIRSTRMTKKEE